MPDNTILGHASGDQTKFYADQCWQQNPKLSPNSWRLWEGLTTGKVMLHNPPAEQATLLAQGCNLIRVDAHRLSADLTLLRDKRIKSYRDQYVILTGLGYTTTPTSRAVAPNVFHSVDPSDLATQLETFLKTTELERVDGILLLQPEYLLAEALTNGTDPASTYQQLLPALTWCEHMVQAGLIQFYGIASNTIGVPGNDPLRFDFGQLWQVANAAAQAAWERRKRPALRLISLPLTPLELGALHLKTTSAKILGGKDVAVSPLELAARMRLNVLAERPHLALAPNQPPIDFSAVEQAVPASAQLAAATLASLHGQTPAAWHQDQVALITNLIASIPSVTAAAAAPHFSESNLNLIQEQGDFADVGSLLLWSEKNKNSLVA